MIIIPTYIEEQNIPAEEKLRLGKEFTIMSMAGDIKAELQEETDPNKESWTDPEIGVLVGASGTKTYRLKGQYFEFFIKLYKAYSNGYPKIKNPKRNAAWSFYKTIIPELNSRNKDEKNLFGLNLLKAARQQAAINAEKDANGQTPQQLQGWITERRYEDFM